MENPEKRLFVADLAVGSVVDDVFLLAEKRRAEKKDGASFLRVRFTDRTGSADGVLWDDVEEIDGNCIAGGAVRVRGTVSQFGDKLQIKIRNMTPVEDFDPADFLPSTGRNVADMFRKLTQITDRMKNPDLLRLIRAFWDDPEFVRLFKQAPAAKKMHHDYLGGLLEHTLSMAILVDRIAGHYRNVDMDLLLTGVILHDVGKVREFEYHNRIDYTTEGRLVTHIVLGCSMIDEKIAAVKEFPKETAMMLKHLVVSHHGGREFGSPVPPMTIEAILLHYIDEIDARVMGVRKYMEKDLAEGDFTAYHRLLDRHFYKRGYFDMRNDHSPEADGEPTPPTEATPDGGNETPPETDA